MRAWNAGGDGAVVVPAKAADRGRAGGLGLYGGAEYVLYDTPVRSPIQLPLLPTSDCLLLLAPTTSLGGCARGLPAQFIVSRPERVVKGLCVSAVWQLCGSCLR